MYPYTMVLIIIIIIVIIYLLINWPIDEYFDAEYTYPYYRDPYSIYLWYDVKRKIDLANISSCRCYSQIRNYIYEPILNK